MSECSSEKRLFCRSIVRTPKTSNPSSVRVPVLSKQTTLILPPMLTRLGEIQKIPLFLKRSIAKVVPMVRVAGRAGGDDNCDEI